MWRLTDQQRKLRDHIREVVLEEIRPMAVKLDDRSPYPTEIHSILAREQLLGLSIPEEYGGRGLSAVAGCAFIEELAKISGTASLIGAYVDLASLPILIGASEELKHKYVSPLCAGESHGGYALSEPDAGSDPAALRTTAERRGDVYVLNGAKRFIGNSGMADFYVVFCRTGGEGAKGISALIVDADSPGVEAGHLETMGMPGWQLGAPTFTDVEVPVENLIGEENGGFKIAMMTFDRSRFVVAAQAVGLAQGAVDLALDYALRRHAMGVPLMEHQGMQFKLAGMEADVAAARALTFQAASFADANDERLTKISSASKLVASDTAMRVTTEAVQVLGGNGYLKDFPAERMMRDAKVLQIYEGSNEIQRLVIARQMAKQGMDREAIWPEVMPGEEAGVASGQPVSG
jgi:alkylation response protein AidB-like acyl-CoA dehydrogenase